jgi:hypothetical protein
VLPDIATHRRFFVRMLTLPPLQVVQVAAERDGRTLNPGNRYPIVDGCATFAAHAAWDKLRRYQSVPGNPSISALINAGSIDWANWFAAIGVPVLAVGPVISQHSDAADLAQ